MNRITAQSSAAIIQKVRNALGDDDADYLQKLIGHPELAARPLAAQMGHNQRPPAARMGHNRGPPIDDVLSPNLAPHVDPVLSKQQVADALGIGMSNLDNMHKRGEAPPRFLVSPRRWGYPASLFRAWQRARLADTEADDLPPTA